jgi:hypothetical protein
MVQIGSDRQPQMTLMKLIQLFFANIRRKFFVWRIDREIHDRIFPHLEKDRDYGYPFNSDEELQKFCADRKFLHLPFVRDIELDIARMPKAYGEAFRYILYRDLERRSNMPSERMKMYQVLAQRRVKRTCDPRFVAVRA